MIKTIADIPTNLNRKNIEQAIIDYIELLKDIPLRNESNNVFEMLTNLKRKKLSFGPYPNVTLFESANRIMTDLTILQGIKRLLDGAIPEIEFEEYLVEFGHDNNNDHDILANDGQTKLVGEAFNVAKSFFQTKKSTALRKLRKRTNEDVVVLLIYNSDAVQEKYNAKPKKNEFHLKIELTFE